MDGLLIVDKPSGPTSHDIVARVRRALRERRIGHTGTLDPMASGVLPLVVGRATRLARFMSGDKTYDATIRLGTSTSTYDALGQPVGASFTGAWPGREAIDAALEEFRGMFLQQPPAYSAKKIAGRRSYELARRGATSPRVSSDPGEEEPTLPAPVHVTAHRIELLEVSDGLARLRVHCSAGFYIRSLAHDVGKNLGTGAHLVALRRIEAAGARIEQAIALDVVQAEGGLAAALDAMIPLERMLIELPSVLLTTDGVSHVRVGRDLGPSDATRGFADAVRAAGGTTPRHVRLFDPAGQLVAMAEAAQAPGLLHPAVVLM
jgi:tRNA pseudouridine55 synthase